MAEEVCGGECRGLGVGDDASRNGGGWVLKVGGKVVGGARGGVVGVCGTDEFKITMLGKPLHEALLAVEGLGKSGSALKFDKGCGTGVEGGNVICDETASGDFIADDALREGKGGRRGGKELKLRAQDDDEKFGPVSSGKGRIPACGGERIEQDGIGRSGRGDSAVNCLQLLLVSGSEVGEEVGAACVVGSMEACWVGCGRRREEGEFILPRIAGGEKQQLGWLVTGCLYWRLGGCDLKREEMGAEERKQEMEKEREHGCWLGGDACSSRVVLG